MKTKLLALLLIISCFSLFAKQVDENTAKTIGLYFLKNKTNSKTLKTVSTLMLNYKATANLVSNSSNQTILFYVYNINTNGYVIVAGDDAVTPILGYSDQGNFNSENMPPALKKWLEGYKNEIAYIINHKIKATNEISNKWKLNINDTNSKISGTSASVSPLIQTHWSQSPYYNAFCPSSSVTGCVATAMAQIMKFWNYPAAGAGFHSYNHPQYGTLSANFGNTTYQWAAMTNSVTSTNSAVATLMYQCGVSVDMNYSPQSSGAYVIQDSPTPTACSEYALKTYFGYNNTLQGLKRINYTETQWLNLLKGELNSGRPIIYAGFGSGGGHCFVADGYDNSDYVHFNWGWAGVSDGYFQVNALNPGSLGSGGGTGGYNSDQQAIIGIQPPASALTYNLALYNYVTPSAATIGYGNAFNVSTNIANYGTNNFVGDYTLAAFDISGNFIDYIETKSNVSLQSLKAYGSNLVFSTTGLFSLLPGTYTLGLFYRPTGGNWKVVQNSGSYTNFRQITVVNSNTIQLYSAMAVSPSTTLTQGQSAAVNLNITNNGTTTFIGQYKVGLYNLDGTFVQTIGTVNEVNGLPMGYIYNSPYLTFTTSAITASPGSYLIALQHKSSTGNWELTGSTTNYINPIKVTVIQAPLLADIYENNDTNNQSYNLPLIFSGNNTNINTNGSNAHIGNDNDFYKVILPSGYNYIISPRLHDNFSSGNGIVYSLDALFSYSTDGVNWSSSFDDVIDNSIAINNGGIIYFHVAPYFQGNTGTYLLDVNLSRTAALGVAENEMTGSLKVFPNPTASKVYFDNSIFNFDKVSIYNILGQEVSSFVFSTFSNNQEVDMEKLAIGEYILKMSNSNEIKSTKIIKN